MSATHGVVADLAQATDVLEAWAEALSHTEPSVLGVLMHFPVSQTPDPAYHQADLLVVVEDSPHPPWERAGHLPSPGLIIPIRIVVVTRQEFRHLRELGNFFLRRILSEGRWLVRKGLQRPDPPLQGVPERELCLV